MPVNRRGLRLERALATLPDLDELRPLREALLETSHRDSSQAWSGAANHLTLDRRWADTGVLESRVTELAEQIRDRSERVLSHSVAALAAVGRGDPAEAARELIAAGELEEASWRLSQARAYYAKALELGRKPRDRSAEGLALKRLARVARTRGELPEALRLYREGFEVSVAERDAAGAVIGCLGVGHVYVDQGRWSEAREWYLRGLDRIDSKATPEYLHLVNALSIVERRTGRLEESEAWLARGEAVAAAVEEPAARAYLEHGRAKLQMARGEFAEAERGLEQLLERNLDPIARISTLINLGDLLLQRGRDNEAERVARQAEELALHYVALGPLAHIYELLGNVAARRLDSDGFLFFEQALNLIREHRLPAMMEATVQLAYGRFEAALGLYDSAEARLEIARAHFQSVGTAIEEREAEMEIEGVRAHRADEVTQPRKSAN